MSEAYITVNGHKLTLGQSMTMRVAMEAFSMVLTEDGIPPEGIEKNYLERIQEIRIMMGYGSPPPTAGESK